MVVKTQNKGREITGVNVGVHNVRRYFPKDAAVIQLELDHLQIQCQLGPSFWSDQPEIQDPRLTAWLQSKNFNQRPCANPIPLALIPNGNNSFRLHPIGLKTRTRLHPKPRPYNPA